MPLVERLRDSFPGRGRAKRRPRLQNSAARKKWRALLGFGLLMVGLGFVVFGVVAGRIPQPDGVQLDPNGTTVIPQTHFFQNPWVLYAQVDDPRRVPSPDDIGCRPQGDLELPAQPDDMTRFGSRVIDEVSVDAVVVFSRSGSNARIECDDAGDYAPLWLLPASPAPAFTPTALAILGVLLAVVGALLHPATAGIPSRLRRT